MKRSHSIILSIAILCLALLIQVLPDNTPAPSDPSQGNSPSNGTTLPREPQVVNLFSDEFFTDVVKISYDYGQVSQDNMGPVVAYLQSLEFFESDTHLQNENENGEELNGYGRIIFEKNDGTTIIFLRSHAMLSNLDGSGSYYITDGNLNQGLANAFQEAGGDPDFNC